MPCRQKKKKTSSQKKFGDLAILGDRAKLSSSLDFLLPSETISDSGQLPNYSCDWLQEVLSEGIWVVWCKALVVKETQSSTLLVVSEKHLLYLHLPRFWKKISSISEPEPSSSSVLMNSSSPATQPSPFRTLAKPLLNERKLTPWGAFQTLFWLHTL